MPFSPPAFGALSRLFDPKEVKYRLTDHLAGAPAPEDFSLAKYLPPVKNQGGMGSCVAQAVCEAAELLDNIARLDDGRQIPQRPYSRLWLYARTRQRENSFPRDAGSVDADALDIAMAGMPEETLLPYRSDASLDPDTVDLDLDDEGRVNKFIMSHRPFYNDDPGGFVGGIIASLKNKWPVVMALSWPHEFNQDANGVMPVIAPNFRQPGHEVLVWGFQASTSLVWCRNSWGEAFPEGDTSLVWSEAGRGDFALPLEVFTNGLVWGCRAVTPAPIGPP